MASPLLFAAVLVLLFLTSWIVLPAPSRTLLTLGVSAPELSAWLVVGSLVAAVLTLAAAGRGPLARATAVIAIVSTMLASVPLVELPFVVRRFNRTIRIALGDDVLRGAPSDRFARMRSAPVVLFDLFRGIDAGDALVSLVASRSRAAERRSARG